MRARTSLFWLLCARAALAQTAAPIAPGVAPADEKPAAIEAFENPVEPTAGPAVEAFERPAVTAAPVEPVRPAAPELPSIRLRGTVRGESSVDTHFDSPRNVPLAENVAEGRLRALVGVDVKVTSNLRLVLEGRAQLRFVTQRSFDRAKAFFEPMLGEAFVDLYTDAVDWRLGNQRIVIGANTALAASDALNPRDLRESFVQGELEDTVLPVFALRAQGELGKLNWLAAYAPFFTPHRYFVFGQDEALSQPGLAPAFDNRRVDPSIEDAVQDRVLETQRPVPFAGDLALRVVVGDGPLDDVTVVEVPQDQVPGGGRLGISELHATAMLQNFSSARFPRCRAKSPGSRRCRDARSASSRGEDPR